jgi:hypothetical protein
LSDLLGKVFFLVKCKCSGYFAECVLPSWHKQNANGMPDGSAASGLRKVPQPLDAAFPIDRRSTTTGSFRTLPMREPASAPQGVYVTLWARLTVSRPTHPSSEERR